MRATSITADHVSRLLLAASQGRNPRRDVALIRFIAETGARPVECAALTWRSLVDAAGALTGRCIWQTAKRGAVRDLPLSEPLQRAIADLFQRAAGAANLDAPVFTTERRGAFAAQSMRAHLKALAAKAGLNASGYSLRHLCLDDVARVVVEAGGTVRDLTHFSGHRSVASVGAYMDKHSSVASAIAEASAARAARF